MKVFVYGTLKRGQPNNILLNGGTFCGSVLFGGYSNYEVKGNPFPLAVRDEEGVITGELFEIDAEHLKALDRLEGFYGKDDPRNLFERIQILIDDEPVYLYVYNHALPAGAERISAWR